MRAYYFIRWNPARLRDPDPFARALTEPVAAKLYENRSQHAVVCMEGDVLRGTIEFYGDFVGCNFFDDLDRLYLSYGFRTQSNGRLFLADTVFHLFDGNSSNRRVTENSFFTVDGQYRMVINDFENTETSETLPRSIDVTHHWENYPEFGRYDAILNVERESHP